MSLTNRPAFAVPGQPNPFSLVELSPDHLTHGVLRAVCDNVTGVVPHLLLGQREKVRRKEDLRTAVSVDKN